MSENGEVEEPEVPATSGETKKSNSIAKKTAENKKKELFKKMANSIKSGAAKQSLLAALGPILLWAFVIIVILIIIIGIAMFLVTMPGMVMEKLKAIVKEVGNYVAAFFGADTTAQIEDTEIYETLDVLEQMGYDLKGEGFLNDFIETDSDISSEEKENLEKKYGNDYKIDEKVGVVRNTEDDSIILARSDFIMSYIMSDNYVYTLKNDNLVTQKDDSSFFEKVGDAIVTAWYKIRNFTLSPLFDALGITDAAIDAWGKGLIVLYYDQDGDDGIGRIKKVVNDGTLFNWDSIKINTKNKTLSIKRRIPLLNNNNAMEYSLDGWTGRYGMPLEFLIAVHKATMMPDLSMDMVTNFKTEIALLLHKVSGEAISGYKIGDDKYIDGDTISVALTGLKGSNILSRWLANFIEWVESDSAKVQAAKDVGVNVGTESCGCTFKTGIGDLDGYALEKKGLINIKYCYVNDVSVRDSEGKEQIIHKKGDEYKGERIDINIVDKACNDCIETVEGIYKYVGKQSDHDYLAYTPYIANVTDHWYRDVYFVVNKNSADKEDVTYTGNLDFVDYDYDYEIMTGERWTLYETDENGDFVYYVLDENNTGDYKRDSDENPIKYEGKVIEGEVEYVKGEESEFLRIASIGEDGTKVAKKAVTFNSSETDIMKDLGWNPNDGDNNVWTAYDIQDTNSSFEPLYNEDDISEEENENYKAVMKNSYINVGLNANIVQVGEGQRTETNSKIKKMFIQNNYFRYDGTDTTAEIIEALRNSVYEERKNSSKNETKYGQIYDDELSITADVTLENQGTKTYKVSDYVGNVTLNQDSLNAFTMLENTHTLDADYIYRDFKELVVELGYFKKEELTDETPKLLQWIVPDIGSAGYPDRSLDKRENEFGTMVHSKSDIEVNKLHTLYEKISQMKEEIQVEGNAPDTEEVSGISTNNNSQKLSQVSGLDTNSNINLKNVKGTGTSFTLERVEESGDGYESVVQSGNVKYIHRYQGGQSYSSINFFWAGGSRTLGQAACGLFACFNVLTGYGYEFDPTKDLPGYNWPATMDAVKNLMEEKGVTGQFIDYTDTAALDSALNEGRPAILLFQSTVDRQGVRWTTGGHFVALAGKDKDGNILTLDSAAQGNVKRHDYPGTTEDMQPAFQSKPIWIADEPPTGMNKDKGNPYEGYEGNEAVVSPVTGILLDYGTYEKTTDQTGENTEKVTTEDPRVNVDLKYGFPNIYENSSEENDQTGDNGGDQQSGDTGFKSEIVSDKVGYARILVLNAENYQKLESATENQWKKDNTSLVRVDQTTVELGDTDQVTSNRVSFIEALNGTRNKTGKDDDYSGEYEDWSELDKTIYGYKEFAETYEKYGIAGYVVYIDGFKCELPDESLSGGEESGDGEESDGDSGSSVASEIPNGKALTKESFKQTGDQINSEQSNEDSLIQTKYESDEVYKLASEKSTNKLSAEVDLKTQAAASISIKDNGNDLIFIKEGTVIGRTLTDKELLESAEFRNGEHGTYEELRGNAKKNETGRGESEDEEDDSKLIGNYLRIIFQDKEGTTVENVEDYMKLDDDDVKTQTDNFSIIGTVLSIDEWVEMAYKYATENNCSSVFQNKENLKKYYNINVEKGVNPEYTFVRGIQESGLKDGASGGGINFWGYATPNGAALGQFSSWEEVLGLYCDTIVKYQDPTTWQYDEIMKRKSEREACSENGGIDPLGYGDPTTVGGQQCLYSWLGDDHLANSAGAGGMYYLYPWGWGGNQYEGENKIIFESKAEFESLCGSKHGTSGGSTSSTKTTVWEQGMYTAYQSRIIVKLAKDIFGERAGTYAAK